MAGLTVSYTTNAGNNTPQGGQYQTGLNLQTTASQLMGGQPLNSQDSQALNQAYLTAGQSQANMQTPQARSDILAGTGMGQLQSQTDDLIQRLAGYDQAVLKPQFAGTDPGTASDMPTSNFVTDAGITALTPNNAALDPTSGIFNSNPIYGFTAQENQGNNFLDLLGTLNDAMQNEYSRGKAQYSTKTGDISRVLGTLANLIQSNNSLASARLSASAKSSSSSNMDKFLTKATAIAKEFSMGKYSLNDNPQLAWGKAWSEIQTLRDKYGLKDEVDPEDIDSILGGSATNVNGKWSGVGNAAPDYLANLGLTQPQKDAIQAGNNLIGSLDSINNIYQNMNDFEKRIPISIASKIPIIAPDMARINTTFFTGLEESLRKSIVGGRVTQPEIAWVKQATLPTEFDTNETYQQRVDAVKEEITKKINNPNYIIGLGGNRTPSPSGTSGQTSGGFTITEVK